MPAEFRPPPLRGRPPAKRKFYAVLVALAAILLLAGLASCGGEASQKSSQGKPSPARTPSRSVPPTTPSDGGESPPSRGNGLDPRFATCAQANAAGYGPYIKDADPEYGWYHDRDHDGIDCERLNGAGSASPEPSGGDGLDPRFDTCAQANTAGYGPYYEDVDPEYAWYEDRDHDGIDCEPWHGGESSTPAPSETPSTSTPTEETPTGETPSEEPSDSGPSMEPSQPEPSEEPSDLTPSDEPSAPAPSEEPSQP